MRIHTYTALASACTIALAVVSPRAGFTQGVAQRSPNLANTWAPAPGVVQLNFTHRFDVSDAPLRKLTNTPSFQVATGVIGPLSAGFTYGSNSDLVPAYLGDVPLDPYDGKPVRLNRTPFGVVVYCLGPDRKDNGGRINPEAPVAPDSDLGFRLWDVDKRRQSAPPPPEDGPPGPGPQGAMP